MNRRPEAIKGPPKRGVVKISGDLGGLRPGGGARRTRPRIRRGVSIPWWCTLHSTNLRHSVDRVPW